MTYSSFIFHRKKIESLGRMTAMTQEEMVAGARTVAAGLEALRAEHTQLLAGLAANTDHANEKASLVKKSIDAIELGLGEAQVNRKTYFKDFF